ncbi:MAG: translocation/assembly module TamB domain-containing protein, partial [Chitinophagales bacterium]|nr:translocation/assembly module TamB domain-containing protein [Chitinophagales bacterium]
GLPDIDETFIDIQMEPLYADMNKLNSFLGTGSIPENIQELGDVNYNGRFTGFIYDFVVYGNISSSAGDAETDVNFKYEKETETASYSGHLVTSNLHIGKITGNEDLLGEISADAQIKGTATGNKIVAELEAKVDKIEVNDYTYQNIHIDGKVNDKLFDGHVQINDPNLKQEFTGKIDLNTEIPTFDFVSDITYANLGKLNLYERDIEISAKTNINFKAGSLDDITGDASIKELQIRDSATVYNLPALEINASGDSMNRILRIQSDLLDAEFTGNYSLAYLPSAIRDMVNIYVKGGQISSTEIAHAQNVIFTIQVKDVKTVTKIFYPDIQDIKALVITGDLNTMSRTFYARITADKFVFKEIDFNNTAIEVLTDNDKLRFFTRIKEIHISDSLIVPVTALEGDFSKDSLNFNLKMGRDTDEERLSLYAGVYLGDSLIRVNILPSEIYLDNEKWDIKANNSLLYDYKSFSAENFILQSGDKTLGLTSVYDATYGTIIKLQLTNILIQDITQIIQYNDSKISGSITANINVGSVFSKPNLMCAGTINELAFDGRKVGNIDITASLLYPNTHLQFNALVKGENSMRAYGFYDIGGDDSLAIDAKINKIPLYVAEPFMTGIFSNMYGDVSGEIKVRGTLEKLDTRGIVEIKQGGLKIDYLNTQYDFAFQKIEITPDKFYLTPNKLTDKFKNEANLSGTVTHSYFDNIYFDNITFHSDKLLLMETTYKQNPEFYGKVIGSANININGPLENLTISVNAKPMKDNNVETIVYLPTYGSGNISKHDWIRFINKSDTEPIVAEYKSSSLVNFDIRLDITPDAKIVLLLSSEGSDTLVARSSGTLRIEANTIDKLDMNGTLTITEGSYNFSFENIVTKRFRIQPGGTIRFIKDPYDAELNLTAFYTAEKVDKNTLTSEPPPAALVDVNVLIHITGQLAAPEINFDIQLAEGSVSFSTFDQKLLALKDDKNELNKQVFGLLLVNQFLPADLSQTSPVQSGVNSTMSEFFTNQLSAYFTDWVSEIFPDAEIDVGLTTIQSGEVGLDESQRQEVDLSFRQRLLNDALTIKIGGTYNYTESSSATSSASNLAGDFEVEYNITPDGRIRVKAFRKSEYDVIGAKNDIKTGLGLFYTKDFNTLAELFGKE